MSFLCVSFQSKAKQNFQPFRDVVFDILIARNGASVLGIFEYISKL